MKLDHNPFGVLRQKSRSLRRKHDHNRIHASSAVACDGRLTSPNLGLLQSSHEDLHAPHFSSRTSSADHHGNHHPSLLHHQHEYSTNSPVLLGDDKELHDPNFVRHNWEMMSGESSLPDKQLHIGRSASPHLTSRRSTLSSRTGSSRPSSRGSEAGGHHTPGFGLGVNAFSGLSSYSQAASAGRAGGARSSSTRGLQVEGSILRDEEAILYSDEDSSDEEDEGEDRYRHDLYPTWQLPTSRPNSRPASRRPSPSHTAPISPRSPVLSASTTHRTGLTPGASTSSSPALYHHLEEQQLANGNAYHHRRHWTVAEGSQASNGAGVHQMPGQTPRGAATTFKERSLSQPA